MRLVIGGVRGTTFLAAFTVATSLAVVCGQPGGEAERKLAAPELILSYDRGGQATVADGTLQLRPNVTQTAYLILVNPEAAEQRVRVELLASPAELPDQVFAWTDLTIAGKNATNKGMTPVTGWKLTLPAAPAATPAAAPAAAAPVPPPSATLAGQQFRVRVSTITRKAGADSLTSLPGKEFSISFLRPEEYVEVLRPTFSKDNELNVQVNTRPTAFRGPDCHVELVVRPEGIPGLIPPAKAVLEGKVGLRTPPCNLFAELRTRGGTPGRGSYSLTVDGWARAFVYSSDFAREEQPPPEKEQQIRLEVQPFTAAVDKLRVRVETDNIRRWEKVPLTVGLYRRGNSAPNVFEERTGAREALIRLLEPAGDGALRLTTVVRDWEFDLDVHSVVGLYVARATLAVDPVALTAERQVTLDPTAPEGIQFTAPAAKSKVKAGETLHVAAAGSDPESGIDKVVFFLGKPSPDHKAPANAVEATGRQDGNTWKAELHVPADAPKGPLTLGVVFTNKAGRSQSELLVVEVAEPAKDEKKPASIAGKVVQGGDPKLGKLTVEDAGQRPQVGLKVNLRTAKGIVATATTDDAGKYKFENLAAGSYSVSSTDGATSRKATVPVELKEFEQKSGVDLQLKR